MVLADYLQVGSGLAGFVVLAWLLSDNRGALPVRTIVSAFVIEIVLALLFLRVAWIQEGLALLNRSVVVLQEATRAGTSLAFGYLGGAALPFKEPFPGAAFILAFQALPIILVISALSALLWHIRVLPFVVRGFAMVLEKTMGIRGAVGLAAAANVFVGMVEAPLLIRPVFARLDRSDLFTLMTCGMATIAGTVLVLYAAILAPVLPDALGHLLVASVLSVPAAIMFARILVPPSTNPDQVDVEPAPAMPSPYASPMDALVRGTQDGLTLLLNVIAMLIVFVALVALSNALLGLLPDLAGAPVTLERLFSWLFAPFCWMIGIPANELADASRLMGQKTVLNEFIAYLEFAKLPAEALTERSQLIMLYAMSGFANFGSLGIMLGGLTVLAPDRRSEILSLGMRSLLAGTLSTGMTGAIVGVI